MFSDYASALSFSTLEFRRQRAMLSIDFYRPRKNVRE